jgi:hypothetical protein
MNIYYTMPDIDVAPPLCNRFFNKIYRVIHERGIVLPELQRFYGRAIVIITPVEMPISDINRPLSIIIFVLYLSVYRVVELSRPEICHLVGVREDGKQSDEFIFRKIGVFNRLKIS